MNLTINTGAALEDATKIDNIVNDIAAAMDDLNTAIKANIPEKVDTTWSNKVRENWEKYYTNDVESAMADMKLSAANLRLAVDEAIKYSQEQ